MSTDLAIADLDREELLALVEAVHIRALIRPRDLWFVRSRRLHQKADAAFERYRQAATEASAAFEQKLGAKSPLRRNEAERAHLQAEQRRERAWHSYEAFSKAAADAWARGEVAS